MLKKLALFFLTIFVFSCIYKQENTTSIIFTGDLLLDRGVQTKIELIGLDSIFSSISPYLKKSCYVISNFESASIYNESPVNKKFVFNSNPNYLSNLKNHGITHLNLANNHSYDQGREGLYKTFRNIKNSGIIPIGVGDNFNEASKPYVFKSSDVVMFSTVTLPLENWFALDNEFTLNQSSIDSLCSEIKKEKYYNSFVVVYIHWGLEYFDKPTIKQRIAARKLIDSGVDLIIGHHPHVIQEIEVYKGKPIFYSIGNFIFDQENPGLLITLKSNENKSLEILPLETHGCMPIEMSIKKSEEIFRNYIPNQYDSHFKKNGNKYYFEYN